MTSPQSGIFVEQTSIHHYLEYAVAPESDIAALRQALADALSGPHDRSGGSPVYPVIAFGPALWQRLSPDGVLEGFHSFGGIDGAGGRGVPVTQRDILVWLHGDDLSAVLDRALDVQRSLSTVARLELDERGFTYHDSRDLTGFVDGTANPKGDDARIAAVVPEGRSGAGGAFVMSQRWVHNLAAFRALPVAEQERVIGRTRPDSVELEGDAMPPDSHVSRTDRKVDGVAQKIYRRSAPFGTVREHGLYFIAFSCDLARFDVLLGHMFGTAGDDVHDRLIEFSTPVTSSYWFAPSQESLSGALTPP